MDIPPPVDIFNELEAYKSQTPEKFSIPCHLKGLDGIRGISALWVSLFHMWQWPQPALNFLIDKFGIITLGNKAVPIFVALSGLLTFRSLESVINKIQI
tara:strand:- start:103 stop:399 length:297 start_codon:yes stop_codon:yes gene_type:complete